MIKFLKQKNKDRGFTLVETLVAIAIFSISILSIMVVLGQGISDANYAKRKMIASYLAQEGVEYMRNMRDTTVISGTGSGWTDFTTIVSSCTIELPCYVDVDVIPHSVISCPSNSCPNLEYESSSGKYGYGLSSSVDSGFTRTVSLVPVGIEGNEVKVSSTVSWIQGSGDYSITLSENLYNWIE